MTQVNARDGIPILIVMRPSGTNRACCRACGPLTGISDRVAFGRPNESAAATPSQRITDDPEHPVMNNRRRFRLAAFCAMALFSAATSADMGKAEMHSSAKEADDMGMMAMPRMRDHMSQMRNHMKRMKSARTDDERLHMMEEHMDMMDDHMDMMMRMMERMDGDEGDAPRDRNAPAPGKGHRRPSEADHSDHHPAD